MPRLRQVPRSEVTDELTLQMYDRLFGDRDPVANPGTATGTPGDWWTVFASGSRCDAARGSRIRALPEPDAVDRSVLRELGQTRAGWARGSQFVFSQHCKSCRALGIDEDKIQAIPHWTVSDCFSPVERAVLAYTDALVLDGGRVHDGVFDALREHLTDEQILEFTYITSMYEMHATMSRALRLEFDDRDDPIVEVPAPEGEMARDIGADISSGET
jgi:alkylhydroperoxidase family enzyme